MTHERRIELGRWDGAQSPAYAWASAAGSAFALVGVGAGNRARRKHVQGHFGVKNFEFAVAAVDKIFDAIESQGRFRDVCGDDNLGCRRM